MKALLLTVSFVLASAASNAIAQVSPAPSNTPQRRAVNRMENLRPLDDRDGLDFSRRTSIENLPAEYRVSAKAAKRTKASDEERELYRDSRKNGVKLLKMFVAPRCADKLVVDVGDPLCAENYDFIPISYYSFFDGIHGQYFGEIRLIDDLLIAGNGRYVQGILLDIGDTDVASIDKRSAPAVKLASFPLAVESKAVDEQKEKLEKGIDFDGELFMSRRKLLAGRTFLLRVVAYGQPNESIGPYNYDSILALRIDKVTDDRMAIILWKKISERTAPVIREEKR
jgi:hypothetical protein